MIEALQFVYAPQIINGLSIGIAVILMALGLTIIFGLLDVINMSHGEFYAAGAFIGLTLLGLGIPFWLCMAIIPLLMFPIGMATERFLIRRVFNSKDRHILTLLLTFGIAIVLEDVYKIMWGANPLRIEAPIPGATEILGVFFPNYRIFLMGFGALIILSVWALIYKTSLGSVIRASAHDRHMTASLGICVTRIYAITFGLGVALAALSGLLLAPIYSVFPTMGRDFILLAFTVVIVGGLGSIKGAVVAGILLSQLQALSALYI